MTNYFNFDISKEASVFTTAFYIVGYSDYLKKLMRDDPNVLPNYSSLPVYVQDLDMVNNKLEFKYHAYYITVECNMINRVEDEEFIVKCWPVVYNAGILATREKSAKVKCWPVVYNVGILKTQEKSTKMNFGEYKTFISMFETDTDYLY